MKKSFIHAPSAFFFHLYQSMEGFLVQSLPKAAAVSFAALGLGCIIGYIVSPPSGAAWFGSKWHEWQHRYGIFGRIQGQIAYVSAVIPMKGYTNVIGFVCDQCYHVDVARTLGENEAVAEELWGESVRVHIPWVQDRQ